MITETNNFEESSFDEQEQHVVRNVKILGYESRNGYKYSLEAVKEAVNLYNNAYVYTNHVKHEARKYKDRIGTIQNPKVIEGKGLYGDLVFNPEHPETKMAIWDAKHDTNGVGLSHSINGNFDKKGKTITKITQVYSVDLVADPATVSNFHESVKSLDEVYEKKFEDLQCYLVEQYQETIDNLSKKIDALTEELAQFKLKEVENNKIKAKPESYITTSFVEKESVADYIKYLKERK